MEINEADYNKLIKHISEDDIQKYLFGGLPDEEMHRIEMILLNNPLETDAIEGLASIKEKKVLDEDLYEISRRIKERVSLNDKLYPVKPLKIWKYNPINIAVGATVSVMLVLAATLFFLKMDFFKKSESFKPAPIGGYTSYSTYLRNNFKCPATIRDEIETFVWVKFIVDEKGKTSAYKILKGFNAAIESEAINLIKKGPKWAPGKKNGKENMQEVTLKIYFHCPK